MEKIRILHKGYACLQSDDEALNDRCTTLEPYAKYHHVAQIGSQSATLFLLQNWTVFSCCEWSEAPS